MKVFAVTKDGNLQDLYAKAEPAARKVMDRTQDGTLRKAGGYTVGEGEAVDELSEGWQIFGLDRQGHSWSATPIEVQE